MGFVFVWEVVLVGVVVELFVGVVVGCIVVGCFVGEGLGVI